jgi:hypothetical protein
VTSYHNQVEFLEQAAVIAGIAVTLLVVFVYAAAIMCLERDFGTRNNPESYITRDEEKRYEEKPMKLPPKEYTGNWQPISTAPEETEVQTKIDDKHGIRNIQTLKRQGNLWFVPDGNMYVYYTPTHWRSN